MDVALDDAFLDALMRILIAAAVFPLMTGPPAFVQTQPSAYGDGPDAASPELPLPGTKLLRQSRKTLTWSLRFGLRPLVAAIFVKSLVNFLP
jgi:hypothetical protein